MQIVEFNLTNSLLLLDSIDVQDFDPLSEILTLVCDESSKAWYNYASTSKGAKMLGSNKKAITSRKKNIVILQTSASEKWPFEWEKLLFLTEI